MPSPAGTGPLPSELMGMANTYAGGIHLIHVTTDDREHQLWVGATLREEAVNSVLDAIPEG